MHQHEDSSSEQLEYEEDDPPFSPVPVAGDDEVWYGYKFVGDNVDKNIKPTFQREEHHTVNSLHHFHGYAICDRVNFFSCLLW